MFLSILYHMQLSMKNVISLGLVLQGFQSAGIRKVFFLNAQGAEDVLSWFLAFSSSFLKD